MRIVGWDIGGAHLKAALLEGGKVAAAMQLACPLWRGIAHLEAALAQAQAALGPADRHAVTMTGELSDIFADRAAGVAGIARVFAARFGDGALAYRPAGFLPLAQAGAHAAEVASANWHATAALAARFHAAALVADMGSTTTDLVPVAAGRVAARGFTDATRLECGELVYTGLVRTALMAVADRAPFGGAWVALAAEHFATTADVFRLLGRLPDGADLMETADGRDKSPEASRARLARMVGRDAAEAPAEAWSALAAWFAEAQLRRIADAAMLVLSRGDLPGDAPVVAAGAGEDVAAALAARLGRRCVRFAELPLRGAAAAEALSRCAPAVAVAVLSDRG